MALDLSRAVWRKSSRSGGNGGQCVEVASLPDMTAVRDSKNPTGPALTFHPDRWSAFLDDVRANRFDQAI